MLAAEARLTVVVPLHPRGVGCGRRRRSVKASQILPQQTAHHLLVELLCAQGHCHVETGQTQTVDSKLEANSCLKHYCLL